MLRPRCILPARIADSRLIAGTALPLVFVLCTACAAPGHGIPKEAPLEQGLQRVGSFAWLPTHAASAPSQASQLTVVVLDDRHSVAGRLRRETGPITRVRAQNRAAVGFLLKKGFDLLGAEARLGPLPQDAVAREHREKHALLRRGFRSVDAWPLYQPLRYQLELGSSGLLVRGVEDPELYDADVASFEAILAIQRARYFRLSPADEQQLDADEQRLRSSIAAKVDARGAAAAAHLLRLAHEGGHERAMIMLGAAHTPAALAHLRKAGVRIGHFRARALDEARGQR